MQLAAALIFLIKTIVGFYVIILLLRLLFQLVRADFYNPISQGIVKLTAPLATPLRRVLPSLGRIDTSTLVLAFAFEALLLLVVCLIRGVDIGWFPLFTWAAMGLIHRLLDIYTVALLLVFILSWVAPHQRHPVSVLAHQLTEPLLRPVRRAVPPLGGLDFSVMIVLLILRVLGSYILPSLNF